LFPYAHDPQQLTTAAVQSPIYLIFRWIRADGHPLYFILVVRSTVCSLVTNVCPIYVQGSLDRWLSSMWSIGDIARRCPDLLRGSGMAKLLQYALMLALWGFCTVPLAFSGPDQNLSTPSTPPSFEADLLRIDRNRFVVKGVAGVERQIHVGKDTEIFGQAKVGDRIQPWVHLDGHAQTIIIVRSGMQ
jgi:hypothetical protein